MYFRVFEYLFQVPVDVVDPNDHGGSQMTRDAHGVRTARTEYMAFTNLFTGRDLVSRKVEPLSRYIV